MERTSFFWGVHAVNARLPGSFLVNIVYCRNCAILNWYMEKQCKLLPLTICLNLRYCINYNNSFNMSRGPRSKSPNHLKFRSSLSSFQEPGNTLQALVVFVQKGLSFPSLHSQWHVLLPGVSHISPKVEFSTPDKAQRCKSLICKNLACFENCHLGLSNCQNWFLILYGFVCLSKWV